MNTVTGVLPQFAALSSALPAISIASPANSAPPRALGSASATTKAAAFGSVAIKVSDTPRSRRWQFLLQEGASRFFRGSCNDEDVCDAPTFRRLAKGVELATGGELRDAIGIINRTVNRNIKYKSDLVNYALIDYWASFRETVLRGTGDCEDIAILKLWMLRAAGINESDVRLLITRSDITGDHAVLVVHLGSLKLILDNLSDEVRTDDEIGSYKPVLSFDTEGEWVHGFKRVASISLLR